MKKITILLLLSFLIVNSAQSQAMWMLLFGSNITNPRITSGIQLGANISFLEKTPTQKPSGTFSIGAYTGYIINEKWQVKAFFMFKSNRGAKDIDTTAEFYPNPDTAMTDPKLERRLSYMDFAPEIHYFFTKSFSIGLGPLFSLNVKARDTWTGKGADDAAVSYEYNVYKQINRIDVGAVIDIQYTMRKGKGIAWNLRYAQGFINPYKGSNAPPAALNAYVYLGAGIPLTEITDKFVKSDKPKKQKKEKKQKAEKK
jgi:hypothetical protein